MRILVTGATGFIGSHLLPRLLARGDEVAVLALPETVSGLQQRDDLHVTSGSLLDPTVTAWATRAAEVVVHLAAVVQPGADLWAVNVRGTQLLLETAVANGVRRFVYCSTVAVYAPAPRRAWPIRESHSLRRPHLSALPNYADSKVVAERLVGHYARRYGLETTILRPSLTYGRPLELRKRAARVHLQPGSLQERLSRLPALQWVHVTDVVNALLLAGSLPSAAGHTFNITGSELFSLHELLATALDRRPDERPSAALRSHTLHYDNTKALRLLGFQTQTTLRQSLHVTPGSRVADNRA